MRILVIDDDPAVREAFQLALESLDFQVALAGSGEEGVEAARSQGADLVFLDLKMPGMDGVDTLQRLREQGVEAEVKIVTAFAEEFMRRLQEAARAGFDFDLVRKPLEREQIRAIVESARGGRT